MTSMKVRLHIDEFLNFIKKPRNNNTTDFIKFITSIAVKNSSFESIDGKMTFVIDDKGIDKTLDRLNMTEHYETIYGALASRDIQAISMALKLYHIKKHKNFLVSKSLVDVLKKVKIDIKGSYLPVDICYYFQFTEEHGYIVESSMIGDEEISYRVVKLNNENSYNLHVRIEPNETLENALLLEIGLNKKLHQKNKKIALWTDEDIALYKLLLNLTLFAHSRPELMEEYNKFAPNQRDKMYGQGYTKQGYIKLELDEDTERLRNRFVTSTEVTGHFRWQPYGPRRSMVKLIFIEPHERHYKD